MSISLGSPWAVALSLALASPAHAALLVDTGTPNGSAVGAYALDSSDFVAGQISFSQAVSLQSISTHVLGGTAGETFTLSLYADNALHLPGGLLYSATATLAANGWNGVSGLSGWSLLAGTYWVAAEVGPLDTAGSGSTTGTLLDGGAPAALARTAFNAGSGYVGSATPMSFGLRIESISPVPEPAQWLTLLAGLSTVALLRRRSPN